MAFVRSVERALRLLFLICQSEHPLKLSDIGRNSGIDKATALRLLQTLEHFELVQRDPLTLGYGPGPGLWRLARNWRNDLRSVSHRHLETLLRATQESVSIVCQRGLERVVIDALSTPRELCVVPSVGTAQPIYAGASGKVIMAFLPDDERDRIIDLTGLKPLTPNGVMDRAEYLRIVDKVRRQGFAYSIGDVTVGAAAVAAPIFDSSGRLEAVVSLRGPEVRMPMQRIKKLAPLVVEAANSISRELGYDLRHTRSA